MELGIINFTPPSVAGDFFASIIYWLVGIVGVVGGIVLFTLLLKLVTFPFDYVSRASMRKNSVKMEEMRPELEKLQKQYADNKDLYNQKMMALYKKNGYSMFGACLPTIITLVIFIIALNGFQAYSQFQNKQYFYDMSVAYNSVVYDGFESDNTYIIEKDGKLVFNYDQIIANGEGTDKGIENTNIKYTFTTETDEDNKKTGKLTVSTDGYVKMVNTCTYNGETVIWNNTPNFYLIDGADLSSLTIVRTENGKEVKYTVAEEKTAELLYNERVQKYVANNIDAEYKNYKETAGDSAKSKEEYKVDLANAYKADVKTSYETFKAQEYKKAFVEDVQQQRSADKYRSTEKSFLWVKNVWVADKSTDHPVHSSWEAFTSAYGQSENNIGEIAYNNLTAKLDAEKNAPNGYFILVILTAGSSLLMQIIMGKSQKAQMELQTVDGQGAQTQKIMKWMMPIMMAIFAFMYTAAFSIYIVLSSIISMLTTFLINFIVDRKLKKNKAVTETGRIHGRVYTPKQEEIAQPKKEEKKKKDDKFAHATGEDFLSGKADKKHVRGRIK